MSTFARALRDRQPDPAGRRWTFLAYDQLDLRVAALDRHDPREVGVVLVECPDKARRRPYHRQKLALVLANLRQFALETAARGIAVRHVVAGSYRDALASLAGELGPIDGATPAERELRAELAPLAADGALRWGPHRGWLTDPTDLPPGPPWRLDAFYRRVRERTGVLMDGGRPAGGRWSFDADNRQAWGGIPAAPTPPTFTPDAVTTEVVDLVAAAFPDHPGRLDPDRLPSTAADARRVWSHALAACLPWFGPFEDAISTRSRTLFHTGISPLLNLHRLWPADVLADALAADLPLASREGFVRQILGWRELVHHVHDATDGLRVGCGLTSRPSAGDGGWSGWTGRSWPGTGPGGAAPERPGTPVPPAFWGAPSGLACLDDVVRGVWEDAWSHHITRLMVLGNIATLLDVDARALTDWFWVAYADAYDWVVEPNVLAMATHATDVMTTKPYIAGSAYLHRMGDACAGCAFDPKSTCPLTPMYWRWLEVHGERFARNPRMAGPVASARRRPEEKKARDAAITAAVRDSLGRGEAVTPARLAALGGAVSGRGDR